MNIAYHVTPARNLKPILREGLIPRRGRRARDAREPSKSIWLFADREAFEYGVMNWLDNMFSDRTRLAVLGVDVSGDACVRNGIELRVPGWISPKRIIVITSDLK